MKNLFFYSEKCQFCLELYKIMKNQHILNLFNLICVDGNDKIPKSITQVPTLVIKDFKTPLVGSSAFNWIKTRKFFNQQSNNYKHQCDSQIHSLQTEGENGPKGMMKKETKNIGDDYAFISDNKETDNNFIKWKDKNSFDTIIFTPILENEKQQKINEQIQNKRMQLIMQNRQTQDHEIQEDKKKPVSVLVPKMEKQIKILRQKKLMEQKRKRR